MSRIVVLVVVSVVSLATLAGCAQVPATVTPPVPAIVTPVPRPEPDTFADQPASTFDTQVAQAGLRAAGYLGSATEMVRSTCENMRLPGSYTAAAILDLQVNGDPQTLKIFKLGIPSLCPDQKPALQDVVAGAIPFGPGTYAVGTTSGQIRPGTYRTNTPAINCKWERTRPDGRILARNSVTRASSLMVTIRAMDGAFSSDRCGTWQRVY
jgi:hypothetical protein